MGGFRTSVHLGLVRLPTTIPLRAKRRSLAKYPSSVQWSLLNKPIRTLHAQFLGRHFFNWMDSGIRSVQESN